MALQKIAHGSTQMKKEVTMNKLLFIICLLLQGLVSVVQAQSYYGIKGGINMPRLHYTDKNLHKLGHDFMLGPSIGVFFEYPIQNHITIAPEANYQQRGGATSYHYSQQYNISYQLEANYLSVRIPCFGYWSNSSVISPYWFVGPDFGYVLSGQISLSQPGLDIPGSHVAINKSNLNQLYVGCLGGVGLRFNISISYITFVLKTDVGINWGFSDTFSKGEQEETANPTNVHAYNNQGHRFSRGLEAHLSIGFISRRSDDVCLHFNTYKPKKIKFNSR